jgi:hypothetical protein
MPEFRKGQPLGGFMRRMLLARRGRYLAAIALCVGVVTAPQPASADPWGINGSTDTGAHPDGGVHGYCRSSSVGSDAIPNISDAELYSLDVPTDTRVTFDSVCNLSGTSETDVVWRQQDLAGYTMGSTFCEDIDGDYCDQYYVQLDMPQIAVGDNDEIDQTMIACHELGHSVGLTHYTSQDCLANRGTNTNPPTGIQYRQYDGHHRDHINLWFS